MFSFTEMPVRYESPENYSRGFRIADTDDFERIAKGISQYIWSATAFDRGRRREKSFLYADIAAFDFEHPEYSIDQALNDFCDCKHIIGTTRNHRKDKDGVTLDRFRVLIPFERRISDLLEFRYNMQRLYEAYPMDKKCLDGARYYFPCAEIVSVSNDGYKQAVHPLPDGWGIRAVKSIQRAGAVSEKLRQDLKREWPVGDRNGTAYRIAKDLMRAGFSLEEVRGLILAGPTYSNISDRSELRKLETTLTGVVKAIEEERSGRDEIRGRQEGSGSDGKAQEEIGGERRKG